MVWWQPEIRMLAPRRVFGGQRFVLRPEIECDWPIRTGGVAISLIGKITFLSEDGYSAGQDRPFWGARHQLSGPQRLNTGKYPFEIAFELPHDAPPSYRGTSFAIRWQAAVVMRRAMWLDTSRWFSLNVDQRPQPVGSLPASQGVWSSRPAGPLPKQPHLEISLGSRHLVPGGVLRGALALSNTQFNHYRGMTIRLTAVEECGIRTGNVVKHWHLPLDTPGENESIPFYFLLPLDLRPSFSFAGVGIRWQLEFQVDVAWKSDPILAIPVTIVPREVAADNSTHEAPLAVGEDRMAVVWQQAGGLTGFSYANGRLTQDLDDVSVEIRREDRGRSGTVVVAEIRYPHLHVGLCWDDKRGLRSNRAEITEAIGDELPARLRSLAPEHVDDELITIERRDITRRVQPLADLCEYVAGIARAVNELLTHLPPAAEVDELEVQRWRGEARRLGARFHPSALRLVGTVEGRSFKLATRWERAAVDPPSAVGLELVVDPGPGLPEGSVVLFDRDDFEGALEALQRVIDKASPAQSWYR